MTDPEVNLERGTANVDRILHENATGIAPARTPLPNSYADALNQAQMPPAPTRKPRSDKGVPKPPKPVDDLIRLTVTLEQARAIAVGLGADHFDLASLVQDQIIAQLQKQIQQLSK